MHRPSPATNRTSPHFMEALENRLFLSAGDLDASFAGNGKAEAKFGDIKISVRDVAMQEDGKMVVVGRYGGDMAVGRFNVNGTPDTSFGPNGNGLVLTHLGKADRPSLANAVAIYPTGELVVVGRSNDSGSPRFAVVKYLSNGTLDTSFSGDGKISTDLGEYYAWANDVVLQTDGKIVIAGAVLTSFLLNPEDSDFAVVRLNVNGGYDDSFAGDGRRFIGFGIEEDADALAIDYTGTPSNNSYYGTIVVAGHQLYGNNNKNRRFAVARLKPNGAFDGRFSGDGRMVHQFPDATSSEATGVLIQSPSKIVVVGRAGPGGARTTNDFGMLRLLYSGKADKTFGEDQIGEVITDFGNGDDGAGDVISAYNERLIVGGTSSGQYALAAFNSEGRVDANFGDDGKVLTGFNTTAGVAGLARGPGTRRFVAAGGRFAARYLDIGANEVSINSLDTNAYEAGVNPASFIVSRVERLPTPVTVGFTLDGTAQHPNDYTSPNIQGPIVEGRIASSALAMGPMTSAITPTGGPGGIPKFGQVTIPANETFAVVNITPVNDAIVEGNETIIVTLNATQTYGLGLRRSVTLDIVDDESQTLSPLADALVKQGTNADANFGTVRTLQSRAKTDNNRRSYLKFDLLSISSVRTISNVKLRLFGNLDGPGNTNIDAGVYYAANTTWDEHTITWNNKPVNGPSPIATATIINQTARWYEWDITAFVKGEKEADYDAITLVLRNTETSNEFASFNSREAKGNQPQLVVTYA